MTGALKGVNRIWLIRRTEPSFFSPLQMFLSGKTDKLFKLVYNIRYS